MCTIITIGKTVYFAAWRIHKLKCIIPYICYSHLINIHYRKVIQALDLIFTCIH